MEEQIQFVVDPESTRFFSKTVQSVSELGSTEALDDYVWHQLMIDAIQDLDHNTIYSFEKVRHENMFGEDSLTYEVHRHAGQRELIEDTVTEDDVQSEGEENNG